MRSIFLCAFALVLGVANSKNIADIARGVFDSLDTDEDDTLVLGEMEAFFKTRDTDGDGVILKSDVLALLHGNRNLADMRFAKYDANKDGVLTLVDVELVYNEFDTDGDGKVSLKDFQAKYDLLLDGTGNTPDGKQPNVNNVEVVEINLDI